MLLLPALGKAHTIGPLGKAMQVQAIGPAAIGPAEAARIGRATNSRLPAFIFSLRWLPATT